MYLFIDTETTGLPKKWGVPITDFDNWPRIVELMWIVYDEFGNKMNCGDYLIKPEGFTIPKSATKIHGITNKDTKEKGVNLSKALNEILLQIKKTKFVVGHHIDFTIDLLASELLRNNFENILVEKKTVCTDEEYSKHFSKLTKSKFLTIGDLNFELFQKKLDQELSGFELLLATANCFFEMKRLQKKVVSPS